MTKYCPHCSGSGFVQKKLGRTKLSVVKGNDMGYYSDSCVIKITSRRIVIASANVGSNYEGLIYISNLVVNPEYRRQGLADRIMAKVIELFPKKELRLHAGPSGGTSISQRQLMRFYSKFGFKATEKGSKWGITMVRPAI